MKKIEIIILLLVGLSLAIVLYIPGNTYGIIGSVIQIAGVVSAFTFNMVKGYYWLAGRSFKKYTTQVLLPFILLYIITIFFYTLYIAELSEVTLSFSIYYTLFHLRRHWPFLSVLLSGCFTVI